MILIWYLSNQVFFIVNLIDITNSVIDTESNEAIHFSQIASFLEAKMQGNPDHIITGVASLDKADANQITFFGKVDGFSSDRMKFFLKDTNAGALILEEGDIENCKKAKNFLIVDNPLVTRN